MKISLARAHTTIVAIFVHGWSFKQLNSYLVTLFLRVSWSLDIDHWFTSFEHGQSSNLNRWSYKWAQINRTVHKKDPANFLEWVIILTWFIYDNVNFGQCSQNLPPWKAKKERFNTLDATINHVKLIDVFQNFTSVLVWYCHTLVQIYVVVYKVFQKLYRDVSRKVVIFRIGKYIYWSEMNKLKISPPRWPLKF